MGVKYGIARYIPDLFRQEPRNVGIFVVGDSGVVVRLVGDNGAGKLDLRRAGAVKEDGELYAEWFAYWQRQAAAALGSGDADDFLRQLRSDGGDMFGVLLGGDYLLDDDEEENLDHIADELYSRLVSDAVQALQLVAAEDEEESPRLHRAIRSTFEEAGILEDRRRADPVPYPIQQKAPVQGTLDIPYKPSFVQRNGRLTVIEDIDFSIRGEERVQNRALSTAFMFHDISEARLEVTPVELITVVHLDPDQNLDAQKIGMGALREVKGNEIVIWDIHQARERFVQERIRVAQGM